MLPPWSWPPRKRSPATVCSLAVISARGGALVGGIVTVGQCRSWWRPVGRGGAPSWRSGPRPTPTDPCDLRRGCQQHWHLVRRWRSARTARSPDAVPRPSHTGPGPRRRRAGEADATTGFATTSSVTVAPSPCGSTADCTTAVPGEPTPGPTCWCSARTSKCASSMRCGDLSTS